MPNFVNMYRPIFLALLFLFLGSNPMHAQVPPKITWRQLATTKFEEVFDAGRNTWSQKANFTAEILALQGQQVRITGYMVPVGALGIAFGSPSPVRALFKAHSSQTDCFFGYPTPSGGMGISGKKIRTTPTHPPGAAPVVTASRRSVFGTTAMGCLKVVRPVYVVFGCVGQHGIAVRRES